MAGSLLPQPKQQFDGVAGLPLIGGKVYTYAAGTLTPKATYQDAALTVANMNPVIANARGEVIMYGSGAYRVILKDALGNTLWDRDDVVAPAIDAAVGTFSASLAAAGGSALVGFQQAGSPRVRTLQDKGRDVASVDDFYLAGEATHGPAIQRAEDWLATRGGGSLVFPGALYTTAQTIVKKSKVHWTGSGRNATVLKLASGANVDMVVGENFAALTGTNGIDGIYGWSIRNMTLDGNKANNASGGGVKVYGYSYDLMHMSIRNFKGKGLIAEWSNSPNAPAVSVDADWWECHLYSLRVHDNDAEGIDWRGPHDSAWVNVMAYFNTGAYQCKIGLPGGGPLQMSNCHAYGGATDYAWYCDQRVVMSNCIGEGGKIGQLYIGQSDSVVHGGEFFAVTTQQPTAKGIILAAGVRGLDIVTKVRDCNGGALDFGTDCASSRINVMSYQTAGTPRTGNIPTDGETTFWNIGVTGYDVQRNPRTVVAMNLGIGQYDMRGGTNVLAFQDGTGPAFGPATGGILYVEGGALKFRNATHIVTVAT